MIEKELSLVKAQAIVHDWIQSKGVRYFNELTNTVILMEEVGELARLVARIYGEQSFKDKEKDLNIADELADILFVLICIANQTGIDLTKAFHQNMDKKNTRDSTRHLENPKLK